MAAPPSGSRPWNDQPLPGAVDTSSTPQVIWIRALAEPGNVPLSWLVAVPTLPFGFPHPAMLAKVGTGGQEAAEGDPERGCHDDPAGECGGRMAQQDADANAHDDQGPQAPGLSGAGVTDDPLLDEQRDGAQCDEEDAPVQKPSVDRHAACSSLSLRPPARDGGAMRDRRTGR